MVSGSDHGEPRLSSTVTVYINVKDVNDNSPTFSQAVYRAEVAEDAEPGSSILQVEATDLDSENNGDIEYSIIGEAEEYFGIYSNGTLYSRRSLDREDKPSLSFILENQPANTVVMAVIRYYSMKTKPMLSGGEENYILPSAHLVLIIVSQNNSR